MMNVPAAPVPSRLLVAAKLTCILQSLNPVPVTKSPPAKLRLGSMATGGYGCDEVFWALGPKVRIAAVDTAPTTRIAAATTIAVPTRMVEARLPSTEQRDHDPNLPAKQHCEDSSRESPKCVRFGNDECTIGLGVALFRCRHQSRPLSNRTREVSHGAGAD